MSLFGDFGHHLYIFVGDYIPNSWVMFNLDIYHHLPTPVTPWEDPGVKYHHRVKKTRLMRDIVPSDCSVEARGPHGAPGCDQCLGGMENMGKPHEIFGSIWEYQI